MEPIPFLSLAPQHTLIHSSVLDVLKSGYEKNWYILGDSLKNFEEEFARYTNVAYCFGVGNGYDALSISLKACGIGPGDEVIVPAHTYIATWLAISKTGGKIVPIEPNPLTFVLDVKRIEESITPKTRVILPVHLYGQACDMTIMEDIAKRHQLMVVEDNAQAHGATWVGRITGSFGHVNATSFYPTKNLGALGDGGAITTNDPEIARFIKRYRNYGFEVKNLCEEVGVNSRLDELQAAVLSIKLKHLENWNEQRREIAAKYKKRLAGVGDIQLPFTSPEANHVYHLFVIRSAFRDKLKEYLASFNVETMVHYPVPPHLQKAYSPSGYKRGDFPITEKIADTALSLPLWPGMEEEQVQYIGDLINKFFQHN